MTQTTLFITVLFIFFSQLHAQVTIGSGIKPNEGALLDLKENDELGANSTKGLGLPKVQLTTILSLDDIDTGLDKGEHIGLTIYVPEEFENSCPGVYVWTGSRWEGINTDASRAPEYITVDDIDGNRYTAKIFNRKGCKGGVYWFTSNLRTTRYNDGTAIVADPSFGNLPFTPVMSFSDGKANTWEFDFDADNTLINVVKTRSDISIANTMQYYENGTIIMETQDRFVSKFGLKYTYNMAWDGDIGAAAVEKKLCPEGWSIPNLRAWVDVIRETGSPSDTDALRNGSEYLGTTSLIEPIDSRTVFASENLEADGTVLVKVTHPSGLDSGWALSVPKPMSEGQVKNAGLNILPSGRISFPTKNADTTKDWSFGAGTYVLEKSNGVMVIFPYKDSANGSNGNQMGSAGRYNVGSSVRCIKVVK